MKIDEKEIYYINKNTIRNREDFFDSAHKKEIEQSDDARNWEFHPVRILSEERYQELIFCENKYFENLLRIKEEL